MERLEVLKAIEKIVVAKAYEMGHISTHRDGSKWQKTPQGWKPVKNGQGGRSSGQSKQSKQSGSSKQSAKPKSQSRTTLPVIEDMDMREAFTTMLNKKQQKEAMDFAKYYKDTYAPESSVEDVLYNEIVPHRLKQYRKARSKNTDDYGFVLEDDDNTSSEPEEDDEDAYDTDYKEWDRALSRSIGDYDDRISSIDFDDDDISDEEVALMDDIIDDLGLDYQDDTEYQDLINTITEAAKNRQKQLKG